MIEPISENNKISINACMLETTLFDDVLLKRLLSTMTSNHALLKNINVEHIGLNGKMQSQLN